MRFLICENNSKPSKEGFLRGAGSSFLIFEGKKTEKSRKRLLNFLQYIEK